MHIEFWDKGKRLETDEMSDTGREIALGLLETMREELQDLEDKAHEVDQAEEQGLKKCLRCGAYINPAYGADEPAAHLDAAGTIDDPRSPGDDDTLCDVCDYGSL